MEDLLHLFTRSLAFIGNIKLHIGCVFIAMMLPQFRRSKRYPMVKLIAQTLLSIFILFYLLKITVAKVRPFVAIEALPPLTIYHRLTSDVYHSFPSSHAGLAAVYLMLFPKNRGIQALSLLVPLERFHSLRHDEIDILVGFALGAIIALGFKIKNGGWRKPRPPFSLTN